MAAPITTSAGRVLTEAEAEIEARVQADADQWAHDVLDTADMLGNTINQARDVHRSGLGAGQLWERLAEHAEKENAPDPLQRAEGEVTETNQANKRKVQTMKQTTSIIAEAYDSHRQFDTIAEAEQFFRDALADEADNYEISHIAKGMTGLNTEGKLQLIGDVDDCMFDIGLNKLMTCDRPGCDHYGKRVVEDSHVHEYEIARFGVFRSTIVYRDEEQQWLVDTYANYARKHDHTLTVAEAIDFAEAINLAAVEAGNRNRAATLRRPTDYCVEPAQDGIGGGL